MSVQAVLLPLFVEVALTVRLVVLDRTCPPSRGPQW